MFAHKSFIYSAVQMNDIVILFLVTVHFSDAIYVARDSTSQLSLYSL